ncbi:Na+/solute symporter [Thermosinus carboxydivorans Nor1]|uniref:Na+/solute symporter n=1 Tax=Thermosinus carboxydivorans Nor1 TaxID=401526 RepID=A1HQY7_9FIRM|nr:sodium:solute symporter family protein [Thermosinus carboxydivorans]EAX47495.1 Na+/solute symporter [Thermosinus carboxydivorans Nor1]
MSIQLSIVIGYIVLLFAISVYAKKKASSGSTDFLFASRKLNTALVAVNIAGLAVGAASTIGVAENAFQVGIAAGWYNAAWAAGAAVMGLVAASKYRDLNCTTVPELFERYYDEKGRIISVIGLITIQVVITSLQYLAGGAILSSLLPEVFTFKSGMITSAVVFIGITLIGGLWSSGLSNIVSVALIYLGVLVGTAMTITQQGGLAAIAAKLPAGTDWFGPVGGLGLATIAGWFVVMITQTITAQGPVQIACGAESAVAARRGFLWGALLIFPIGFLCALMGLAAKVAYPSVQATMALPKIIMSLGPVIAGTTLAALWAADVSTACTLLLGAGTLFAQDIYKRFINPSVDDRTYLLINRLTILGLGVVTLWMAFNAVGILKTLLIGLSLTTAFTLVFLCTIFMPWLCRRNSAFYTTLAGMAALLAWQFIPAIRIFAHPIYLEWLVCVITFLTVAVIDKQKIAHGGEEPAVGAEIRVNDIHG